MPMLVLNWLVTHIIDEESPLSPHLAKLGFVSPDVEAQGVIHAVPDGAELLHGNLADLDMYILFNSEDSVQRERLNAVHLYHAVDFVGGAMFRDMVSIDSLGTTRSFSNIGTGAVMDLRKIHDVVPASRAATHLPASTGAQSFLRPNGSSYHVDAKQGPQTNDYCAQASSLASPVIAPAAASGNFDLETAGIQPQPAHSNNELMLSPATLMHNLSTLDASSVTLLQFDDAVNARVGLGTQQSLSGPVRRSHNGSSGPIN